MKLHIGISIGVLALLAIGATLWYRRWKKAQDKRTRPPATRAESPNVRGDAPVLPEADDDLEETTLVTAR